MSENDTIRAPTTPIIRRTHAIASDAECDGEDHRFVASLPAQVCRQEWARQPSGEQSLAPPKFPEFAAVFMPQFVEASFDGGEANSVIGELEDTLRLDSGNLIDSAQCAQM